ncbi:MAG: RluA family pseudouridine synthase [Bacteroidetes bacterium]|nr:RluA family pseudouridine synthase [Bacteroidota bacterium]MCB9044209.1 RluA family pseudouridine synthase [Chitinophagales bacterium]
MSENEEDIFLNDNNEEQEELYEHYRFTADRKQSLLRIDKFLGDRLENTSRNRIQNAAKASSILVNGIAVKQNYKVKPNDVISIVLPYPERNNTLEPENIPLDIVYEDEAVLVLNKPAGLVVHPGVGNFDGTLVNGLLYHFQNLPARSGDAYPGLVHRIDKDTTGLLVIAKDDESMSFLAKQFFNRTVYRRYIALVWGDLPDEEGIIEGNIGRHARYRKMMDVYPEGDAGKPARTHYKVLERLGYVSVVECRLETGRTHQIRVHFKYIGHPLFNDPLYDGNRIVKGTIYSKYKQFVENCFSLLPRQALHARALGFVHPRTGEYLQFEADMPEDMQTVIDKWRNYMQNR